MKDKELRKHLEVRAGVSFADGGVHWGTVSVVSDLKHKISSLEATLKSVEKGQQAILEHLGCELHTTPSQPAMVVLKKLEDKK